MKHFLLITYYWPPSGGAGVQRWLKICKYIKEFGYEPVVLTVSPDSASYPQIDTSFIKEAEKAGTLVYTTKSFEPLSLYKALSGNKKLPHGGLGTFSKPSLKSKILRFIRGNFFIPDPRKGWNKYAYSKALELIDEYNIKCVVTTSPPHSTQLIGLQLKKQKDIKWLADFRDPWTDIYYYKELMHLPFVKAIDKNLETEVLTKADKVITVSRHLKTLLKSKNDLLSGDKIEVITNGYDPDDFSTEPQEGSSQYTIAYTGTIDNSYRPKVFFNAIAGQKNNNIRLQFTGTNPNIIGNLIAENKLKEQCSFTPTVPHLESIKYLQKANALLLLIPHVQDAELIVTGKLFEYLAAGKPIICIGPKNGSAAQIIKECNAGQVFERDETNELAAYIGSLAAGTYNHKPNQDAINNYSRKNQAKQFAMCFNTMLDALGGK